MQAHPECHRHIVHPEFKQAWRINDCMKTGSAANMPKSRVSEPTYGLEPEDEKQANSAASTSSGRQIFAAAEYLDSRPLAHAHFKLPHFMWPNLPLEIEVLPADASCSSGKFRGHHGFGARSAARYILVGTFSWVASQATSALKPLRRQLVLLKCSLDSAISTVKLNLVTPSLPRDQGGLNLCLHTWPLVSSKQLVVCSLVAWRRTVDT